MKLWSIHVQGFNIERRRAETRGQAHAWAFKRLVELGYKVEWGDIKVRVVPEATKEEL